MSGPSHRGLVVDALWGLGAAVLALVAGAWSLRIWDWRVGTPFTLDGDGPFVSMQLRDLADHGWYWNNPDLGYPFGQNGSLFPELNVLHVGIVKLLGLAAARPLHAGRRLLRPRASRWRPSPCSRSPAARASAAGPRWSRACCSPTPRGTRSGSTTSGWPPTGSSRWACGWCSRCCAGDGFFQRDPRAHGIRSWLPLRGVLAVDGDGGGRPQRRLLRGVHPAAARCGHGRQALADGEPAGCPAGSRSRAW